MSVITAAPPVLLPELLGVSPHLVLDTIVNISNNSVEHCVDAMEGFLTGWAEKRAEKLKGSGGDWDSKQEIEQGIVSFQTLLESHMDIAVDFFEVWCMRNIFTIRAELPVVVPHQAGLILDQPASKEQELLAEIDDLRRRIQVVRICRPFQVGQFIYSVFLATKTQAYVQEGVADFCGAKDGE
jgi:kinetochore protein Mis12/MTW1